VHFEFATATRIIFGAGALEQIGPLAAGMGRRALVVRGQDAARAAPLLTLLAREGLATAAFAVAGEPTTDLVRRGVRQAQEERCDVIIGFGGGSALDTGKAIAALLANGGDLEDYLEIGGRGTTLTQPSAPFIAIPTTAGTGAEVTRNAVLSSPERRVKASLRSPLMLPRLALVDPALTHALPPALTASTGLDALTQLVEPYVSSRANPLTDALCREGIGRVARSLRRAVAQGDDAAAREDMALASLLGGLALANAGLGAVHGFAGPIGGRFPAPHGAVCGRLLPRVMAANMRALQQAGGAALRRYDEIAQLVTGDPHATAQDGVAWVRDLVEALQMPPLASYGVTPQDLPMLVEEAAAASSMQANPIKLTSEQLQGILAEAL
jgi:alcohol dehydrogenase class IV